MTQKPDVFLIILDTTRRDRLSIYTGEGDTSPHFDDFASKATLFERAVAPAQWTIPAHASLFTGTYPTTHQLTEAGQMLSGSYPTLAEILQVEGYHTAAFCNNPLVGVLDNGLQRGFDAFYNYAGAAPNRPQDTHKSAVRRALSRRWRTFARRVSNRFAHSDWLFAVSMNPRLVPLWTRYINYTGHTTHSIDDMLTYVQHHHRTQRETPFFGFLNLMGAHLPYHPPREYLDPELRKDRAAYRFMGRFNADGARWASPAAEPMSDWEQHVLDHFYRAEIAHQDAQLGRLLRYLETRDDALVIVAADHGEGHGDHGFFGHSFVVYQELVHVPLAIRYPAQYPSGKRVAQNVSTRRLFHTVLDATGITPPLDATDPNADVDGLSLAHALNGTQDADNGLAFSEAFPPSTILNLLAKRRPEQVEALRLTQVRRGVYRDDHKLATVGDSIEGLFDLRTDPAETQDIAAQHSAISTELRAKIDSFVATAAHFRAGGSGYAEVGAEMEDHLRALGYLE